MDMVDGTEFRQVPTMKQVHHMVHHSKLQFDDKKIGIGAFGVIYKAFHTEWGCQVAYKSIASKFIVDAERRTILESLSNEAEIHHQLRHPNIVSMLGLVFEEGHYGLVLEYVQYGSLSKFLDNLKAMKGAPLFMSSVMKTRIAYEVCCGMSYLHTLPQPVIHRDLKIENTLLGEQLRVKISDFGLSKWKGLPSTYTSNRLIAGTASHIPPEKWRNPDQSADDKFDVYSFGILLWELFTEEKAFHNAQEDEIEVIVSDIMAVYNRPADVTQQSEHARKMERASQQLTAIIRRTDQILTHLHNEGAVTSHEYDEIRSQSTVYDLTRRLINVLSGKPLAAYQCFLDALKSTGQRYLCQLLKGSELELKHIDDLREHSSTYRSMISVSGTNLLDQLQQSDVLDQQEIEEILSKTTEHAKVDRLLQFMMRTSHDQYQLFLDFIRSSKLPAAAVDGRKLIDTKIANRLNAVKEFIECKYGLLDQLVTTGVLTDKQVNDILAVKTAYGQSYELVKLLSSIMTDATKYEHFLMALHRTGQGHLVKYITGNADVFDMDRPLNQTERDNIEANSGLTTKCLDPRYGLLKQLHTANVITDIHLSSINLPGTSEDRQAQELLEIMKCRSFAQYQQFLEYLIATGHQRHMRLLDQGNALMAFSSSHDQGSLDTLMSSENRTNLLRNRTDLVENMSLEGTVMNKLLSKFVLTREMYQQIKSKQSRVQQIELFLDIMPTRPNRAFNDLIETLRTTGQEHVAAVLISDDCNANPTVHALRLKGHWLRLRQFMDPEFGLPFYLLKVNLLTHEHTSEIQSFQENYQKQNDFIIRLLLSSNVNLLPEQYSLFLDALMYTSQTHVRNYLEAENDVTVYGDMRPLVNELEYIDANSFVLAELLQPTTAFLDDLKRTACITSKHHEHIVNVERTAEKKNQKLLSILRRRSYESWKLFIDAIRTDLCFPDVADALEKRKEVLFPPIHLQFDLQAGAEPAYVPQRSTIKPTINTYCNGCGDFAMTSAMDFDDGCSLEKYQDLVKRMRLNNYEEQLAKRAKTVLNMDTNYYTKNGITNTLGTIVALRKGNSIEVFMTCRSLDCALNMDEMYKCGFLQELFTDLFRRLALDASISLRPVSLRINQAGLYRVVEYCKGKECVEGAAEQQHLNLQVARLPFELWKGIIFKTAQIEFQKEQQNGMEALQAARNIYETISSVCHKWRLIAFFCLPKAFHTVKYSKFTSINADALEELLLKVFMSHYKRNWEYNTTPSSGVILYERLASVSVSWKDAMKRRSFLIKLRKHVQVFYCRCVVLLSMRDNSIISAKDSSRTTLMLPIFYGLISYSEICLSLLQLSWEDINRFPESKNVITGKVIAVAENYCIDINAIHKDGYTALFTAAFHGYHKIYKRLLRCGAKKQLPQCVKDYELVAFAAGWCDSLDSIRDLFNDCYQPCTHTKSIDFMYHLLQHDNKPGTDGAMVLLKENNIDIEAKFETGVTALHGCATHGKLDALKILVAHGANLKAVCCEGQNILHYAAIGGQLDMLKYLLSVDDVPEVNSRAENEMTLFHFAAIAGRVEQLEFLSEMSCFDLDDRRNNGESALHIAAYYGKLDALKYLLQLGLDVNAIDKAGFNVLHKAAQYGQNDVLKYLLTISGAPDITYRSSNQWSLFHHAAAGGNVDLLELFSENKQFDINDRAEGGETALHIAARCGKIEAIEYLLQLGLDVNALDTEGRNVLHKAVQSGQNDVLKYLLTISGAPDITYRSSNQWSLFHHAAAGGNVDLLKLFSENKQFDINDRAEGGETALHIAARCGKIEAIKYLLQLGLDVNALDTEGRNVLHKAAHSGQKDVLKYLLTINGAPDITSRSSNQWSLLHQAAACGIVDLLKMFSENKQFDINDRTKSEETALHIAARCGKIDAVKYLLERGLDVNALDTEGRNVLHKAAQFGQIDVLKYLLTISGAPDITSRSSNQWSIFHYAAAGGNVDLFKMLSENNQFYINDRTESGETALHIAARYGKIDAVKYLLELGLDVNASDREDQNILHKAAESGQSYVFKYLLNPSVRAAPKITSRSRGQWSVFHHAAAGGCVAILKLLSENEKFNANDRTESEETALHIAARCGKIEAVKYLLQLGLDVNALDTEGRNVLHKAAQFGQIDVLKYLLTISGAPDITSRSSNQWSLFHHAAAGGNVDLLKMLSENKRFDINDRTDSGQTALHIAALCGKIDAVKYLFELGLDVNTSDREDQNK